MIENAPDLMGLVADRAEVLQRSEIGVLLHCYRPLAVQVVCEPRRRNEFEVFHPARVIGVDNRIQDEIHFAQMGAHDRPYLGGNASWFPIEAIDAELEVDAIEELVLGCMWPHEQLP